MGTDFLERIGELAERRRCRGCCRRAEAHAADERRDRPALRRRHRALPRAPARRAAAGGAHAGAVRATRSRACSAAPTRRRAAAPGADAPHAPLGGAAARRRAWRRAASRWCSRPGAASTAGWAAKARSPPTRCEDVRAPKARPAAAQGAVGRPRGGAGRRIATTTADAGAGGARRAASSSCSTAAACASASWSGSTSRASARRAGWIDAADARRTCSARAASGAACRSARRRWRRCAPGWRCAAGWRAPGEPALFVSRRGTRLDAEPGALAPEARRRCGRPADARASAHAAPLVRHPPAAVQRRPARGAGAAGPRQHHDHAGLHAARLPAPGQGLRRRASARQEARRAGASEQRRTAAR